MTNVVSEEECRDTNGDGDCVNCTRNPWLCPKKGVYLDKWPRLIVVGEAVTEEQAMEIIIRTQHLYYFHSNDKAWQNLVETAFGVRDIEEFRGNYQNWQKLMDARKAELGTLDLEYLTNARIISSWIGGPKGWVDWDGSIGCASWNIGKWPSESDVTAEWVTIASAFPWLKLKAQLITHEGEGILACEHTVADGHVTLDRHPTAKLIPDFAIKDADASVMSGVIGLLTGSLDRERGCTIEKLHEAIAHTKAVIAKITTERTTT